MYSVSSIAKNSYLMYSIAQKGNSSLTASSWLTGTTSNVSSLSGTSASTNSAASDIAAMWEKYQSGTSTTSSSSSVPTISSDLTTISNVKSSTASLLKSYTETSKTFSATLGSTLSDLKTSAAAVKNMSFDVTSGTDTQNKTNLTNALKNIKSLVSNYNDAISFFSDNSSISGRVKNLAASFSDTTYKASTFAKIGLQVDGSTGKISINETKLTKALQENPDSVAYQLGTNGLAGKAESKAAAAESQKSTLFPSVSTMLGSSLKTASLYSPKTLTSMTSYTNVGNLLDLYF